jgi:hypothetical protein
MIDPLIEEINEDAGRIRWASSTFVTEQLGELRPVGP